MGRSLIARRYRERFGTPPSETIATALTNATRTFESTFPLDQWPRRGPSQQRDRRIRIAVIGGGLAGLTTAACLGQIHNVTIFESSNAIGGRVRTDRRFAEGHPVELGGELIGYGHPATMLAARRFAVPLSPINTDADYQFMYGTEAPQTAARTKIPKERTSLLDALCANARQIFRHPIEIYEPWRIYKHTIQRQDVSVADWLATQPFDAIEKEEFAQGITNHNGAPVEHQSLHALFAQVLGPSMFLQENGMPDAQAYAYLTENCKCTMGNDQLICALRRHIESIGVAVQQDCPVEAIENHGLPRVVVRSRRNRIQRAGMFDKVVVCVPAEVASRIRFHGYAVDGYPWTPPQMSSGDVVKYLVETSDRFWLTEDAIVSPSQFTPLVGQTWEGTQHRSSTGPSVLTVFTGGPSAAAARSNPSAHYHRALKRIFGALPVQSAYRGKFVDWSEDSHFRGGYSAPQPDQLRNLERLGELRGHGIHFAGEYTCPPFLGYIEGAIQSACVATADIIGHDWRFSLTR